ncbi:hypothetical protein [Brevundimonas sp. SL130]|uniref:hypothetical protein n=1 Tax=Brevundimonas sp. SL130 TaxID=2995143 RepID=UPI00226CD26C|nr:hypothetical protein [Brevundimonas sp. SL130]WAC60791.1 hypothetical protein OU998_04915 [Brevundimonas sp. SL130]
MNIERVAYVSLLVIAAFVGFAAYRLGGPLILGNEKAMDVIVTLFSILAGFIIAIMSLLNTDALRPGGWKRVQNDTELVRRRLDRQQQLFWLYLATLTFILGSRLVPKSQVDLSNELQRVSFGLAAAALVLSYALPVVLRGVQVARLEANVTKEKKKASILERN